MYSENSEIIRGLDFKSGICLFIAPVRVHCFSITFRDIF